MIRMQYAHPDRVRVPAKAKTEWMVNLGTALMPRYVMRYSWEPHKVRSKYMPHQGKRELARRVWQITTGRG